MSDEIMDVSTGDSAESWVGSDGAIAMDAAPEAVRDLCGKKQWDNINQVFDSYGQLEKFKGISDDNHIVLPEGDDPQLWDQVYNKLGRPESHKGYELDYEGDVAVDDALMGSFKQFAHGLGLNQKQFNAVVGFQLDAVAEQVKAANQTIEQNIESLKQKFGDKYDAKVLGSRQIADKLGIYKTLEAKGLASDPDIISMLDRIKSATGEDVLMPQGDTKPTQSTQTELDAVMKDPAWKDRYHKDHDKVHKRYMELCAQKANEETRRQAV